MGFCKGSATLSRYRVMEEPEAGLTVDFVRERLVANAFMDIEDTSEESSVGWVELMNHLSGGFSEETFHFGEIHAFNLRQDERRLSGKILGRYVGLWEAKFAAQTGRKPNAPKRREMRETIRLDLLRRSLLDTRLMEVLWLAEANEVWLGAAGEKNRAVFEDLWSRTFGLGLKLLVPVAVGLELLSDARRRQLLNLDGRPFFEGE